MQEKTIFELIVEGKLPCNKVLESDDFLAFHAELMAKMTSFIQELAVLLGVDKSGYRLVTNCGKNSGQEVFHLHFHMLGGFELPKEKTKKENPQALF